MNVKVKGDAIHFPARDSILSTPKIMRGVSLLCFLWLLFGTGNGFASTGSNNPNDFLSFHIDWCFQLGGCSGQTMTTPQPWTLGAYTGTIYLTSHQDIQVYSQVPPGTGWYGNFINGMGVVYNGVTTLHNNPGGIVVSFNTPVAGTGAYIQPYFIYSGPFTASIQLFDSSWAPLGPPFIENGFSDNQVGTAIYIGAYDNFNDVSYAVFDTISSPAPFEDFGITLVGVRLAQQATPEPGTLLLMGPTLLGLVSVQRRRMPGRSPRVP